MDYNVALLPDPTTRTALIRLSCNIGERTVNSMRLGEEEALPHLTLYLASFGPKSAPQIGRVLRTVCSRNSPVAVLVRGWSMSSNGLVMMKCFPTNDLLRLHQNIVTAMKPLRLKEAADVWKAGRAGFSNRQADLLRDIGYPYALDQWSPHFTVARVDADRVDEVTGVLNNFDASFVARTIALGLSNRDGSFLRVADSCELGSTGAN